MSNGENPPPFLGEGVGNPSLPIWPMWVLLWVQPNHSNQGGDRVPILEVVKK